LLHSFFRWGTRRDLTHVDPTEGLPRTRPLPERPAIPWTAIEQQRLLDACRGIFDKQDPGRKFLHSRPGQRRGVSAVPPEYLYPLVFLGLRTGLRLGDLLHLEWRHIDFVRQRIIIPGVEVRTLTDIDIPLHPDVRALLEEIFSQALSLPQVPPRILEAVGLPMWKGLPDEREVLHVFRVVRRHADIQKGDFNSLRVSFLRNCALARVPMKDAARLCDWDGEGAILNLIYEDGALETRFPLR